MSQVGLPNVGKSTLFNTLTKLSIPAENFPFCTIEPNEARVNVPDERFEWLCQLHKPKSEVRLFSSLKTHFLSVKPIHINKICEGLHKLVGKKVAFVNPVTFCT